MHYIIYKTTNLINGKFYIGKHQTNDLNDGYIGSGKLLKHAINKYGLDQFKTEILETCPSEAHMNLAEKIYVVVDPEVSYNLCPGGRGGFGYINSTNKNRYKRTEKIKQKGSDSIKRWIANNPERRELYQKRASRALVSKYASGEIVVRKIFGRKHSAETKQKMSIRAKNRSTNSQTGTMWITNGTENKKIKKNFPIPDLWYKGRTLKLGNVPGKVTEQSAKL